MPRAKEIFLRAILDTRAIGSAPWRRVLTLEYTGKERLQKMGHSHEKKETRIS
jgi:hypothetical protein